MNSEQTTDFVRKAVALRYYTDVGVSLGYCAQIAGMTKGEFIRFLGENKTSIFQFNSEADFMDRLIQNGLFVSPEVQASVLKIAEE